MVKKLRETYGFNELQTFLLYFEIIRLTIEGKAAGVIEQIRAAIDLLNTFCPSLRKEDLHFLFLYHSEEISERRVDDFMRLVEHEIYSKDLQRLILSEDCLSTILGLMEAWVNAIAAPGHAVNPSEADRFKASFSQTLRAGIFPPEQPLTDFLNVADVTSEEVQWRESVRKTHLGQLKFVAPGARLAVYFQWMVHPDGPVFLFSFFDLFNKRAQSAFIPIGLPMEQLERTDRSGPFYSLLSGLSLKVLKEEVSRSIPQDAPDTPEFWVNAFGVLEYLQTFSKDVESGRLTSEKIGKVWDFLKAVKIGYRNLFSETVKEKQFTPPTDEAVAVAALGRIFPTQPQSALLPQKLLDLQADKRYFLPDGARESLGIYRKAFSVPTREFRELGLNLAVLGCAPLPALYRVQTMEDLLGEAMPAQSMGPVCVTLATSEPKLHMDLQYTATVLQDERAFEACFDFHNLLFKAQVYRALLAQPRP